MLKVKPVEGYPPEAGRYVRGNEYSPVAVCTILDTFDYAIPQDLNELVLAGWIPALPLPACCRLRISGWRR